MGSKCVCTYWCDMCKKEVANGDKLKEVVLEFRPGYGSDMYMFVNKKVCQDCYYKVMKQYKWLVKELFDETPGWEREATPGYMVT